MDSQLLTNLLKSQFLPISYVGPLCADIKYLFHTVNVTSIDFVLRKRNRDGQKIYSSRIQTRKIRIIIFRHCNLLLFLDPDLELILEIQIRAKIHLEVRNIGMYFCPKIWTPKLTRSKNNTSTQHYWQSFFFSSSSLQSPNRKSSLSPFPWVLQTPSPSLFRRRRFCESSVAILWDLQMPSPLLLSSLLLRVAGHIACRTASRRRSTSSCCGR